MKPKVSFKVFEFMKIVNELRDYLADLRYLVLLHESPGNEKVCAIS